MVLQTVATPPGTLGRLLGYRVHAAKVVRLVAQTAAQQARPLGNVRLLAPITRTTLVTEPLAATVHQVVERHLLAAPVHEIGTSRMHGPFAGIAGGQRFGGAAWATHLIAQTLGTHGVRFGLQ